MTVSDRPRSLIKAALWQIENGISASLDLGTLAARCGVTPAHLIRAMRLSTGHSPMAYARARSLSRAAKRLAATSDDILQVALDAGYGSHEAFTRAFTAEFGCRPSALRRGTPLSSLTLTEPLTMQTQSSITLAAPRRERRDAFEVTGMSGHFTFESVLEIPALWVGMTARDDELSPVQPCAYGISFEAGADGFRYMAGFATAPGAEVPHGMTRLKVPAGEYAVYLHDRHVSEMHLTMKAIFDTGLPSAGLSARNAPELEIYDDRFDPKTGTGPVELWIPVQDAGA